MKTQIVYSEEFNKHNNPGHPENAQRLNAMINEINKSAIKDKLDFIKPEILPEKILYETHSEWMIENIKNLSLEEGGWIDLDTYVCQSDYETARLAAGGMLQACNNVLNQDAKNAFALVRPPGHHATINHSMGFCLFNNIAISANQVAKKGKKILIYDFDVHHGNGTQEIFYNRNDVLYQSTHLSPHYPGTGSIDEIGKDNGEGYTMNAPLYYGKGDKAVSKILDEIFLPVARQFKPNIILFSAGYDSHHMDSLGGLRLTANFYGKIIEKYQKIQPKIVLTLEGGYNLNWIGKCLVSQLGQMTYQKIKIKDSADEDSNVDDVVTKLKNKFKKYWEI